MTSYLPWPLTFISHLGSKIFSLFEQNGGFWPFQGQSHWPIFFISRKGSDQTASIDIWRVKIGSAVLAAPSSKSVKSEKKNYEPLYVAPSRNGFSIREGGTKMICELNWIECVPSSGKIFLKPNFAGLFRSITLSIMLNIFPIGSLGCLWQGVKLRHFQCKPWVAITTVVLPYNCDMRFLIFKFQCNWTCIAWKF